MVKEKHKNNVEWIIYVGGLIVVILCIVMVGILLGKSMNQNLDFPEYGVAFFSSITTLILGYIFGRGKK